MKAEYKIVGKYSGLVDDGLMTRSLATKDNKMTNLWKNLLTFPIDHKVYDQMTHMVGNLVR